MVNSKGRAEIFVSGRVQGVGYRYFTEDIAAEMSLTGFTKNLPDGRVHVEVEGEVDEIKKFIERLRTGPSAARVLNVQIKWKDYEGIYPDFSIRF
ncbi:MAG: acylphosphatase [Nitrospirae bacterium]|nr:acylphosphatase [Nitrospirota bacterium]